MIDQPSLPGFEPPPPAIPSDRLLFLIYTESVADRVARLAWDLREGYKLKGRPLPRDRFHITLHHLGDYEGEPPRDVVAAACKAAATIAPAPFEVVFDRVASFRKSRGAPLVLLGDEGVHELKAFQRLIGATMAKSGLGRFVEKRFTPHVTLLYEDRIIAERPIEPIRWTIREFVLVQSLLGQTRHVQLARWPLRG